MRYLRPPDFFLLLKLIIINSAEFYFWTLQNLLFVCVCVCVFPRDRQMTQFLLGLQVFFFFCAILRTRSSFHFRKFSKDGAPISRMMVALSADRHMVLRHLKIALICKWRLTVLLGSLMDDLRVVGTRHPKRWRHQVRTNRLQLHGASGFSVL